ncbi:MAG TPA: PfkB family carbohydrate kinase, partial [Anaerolineae bacterium]|nr:PfkB family carbohydrate kinase [Anaerolineae bacterium]
FFVSTDQTNNQIALFYTGAMAKAGRISFANQDYQKIKLAIISPNDPWAMVKYAQECHDLRIPYIYDPSQQIPRLEAEDLVRGIEGAQILMLNDYEYEMIKNKTGLSEAGIKARVETLIVTQGEKGSFIHSEGHDIHIPVAKPNRIADPTGVGDAYRAGLIAGIMRGYPWEVAGRLGSVTAVYVLEQHGTQRHTYNRQLVANRYRDHFGHTDELDDFVSFSPESI